MFEGRHLIIFDMDGTLIDSVGIWNRVDEDLVGKLSGGTWRVGEDLQAQRDAMLRKYSSCGDPYREYCAFLGRKYGSPLSGEAIHALRYEISQRFLREEVDYKPFAADFVKALSRRGFQCAIATTTRKANMDIYRTANRNILSKAPVDRYFSPVLTREDVKEIKPNPEVFLRVMAACSAAPGECLVFEDSLTGVEAARRAGIDVAVMYDRHSDGERKAINALAQYRFGGFTEALAALERELP